MEKRSIEEVSGFEAFESYDAYDMDRIEDMNLAYARKSVIRHRGAMLTVYVQQDGSVDVLDVLGAVVCQGSFADGIFDSEEQDQALVERIETVCGYLAA